MAALTANVKVWRFIAAIIVLLTVFFTIAFYFKPIFITFIVGMAMILLTESMIRDYGKRMDKYNFRGWKATVLGYSLFFFWIFVIFFTLGTSLSEFKDVTQTLSETDRSVTQVYVDKIDNYIPNLLKERFMNEENIQKAEGTVISTLSTIVSQIGIFVFNGILIIPIMFFMYFKRKDDIIKQVFDIVPNKFHEGFIKAVNDTAMQLHDFFMAKITESIVVGSICCFGFYIIGLKGWLVLGLLAGALNIVPYLGPIIGAIPPIMIGLLDSSTTGLYVIVTVVIAQAIDNFYLIPFMITGKVKVDPLLGIVLILVGAKIYGVLGMVLAIPIYLIYKIILRESYQELVKIYTRPRKTK